jgi:hypothetical protein
MLCTIQTERTEREDELGNAPQEPSQNLRIVTEQPRSCYRRANDRMKQEQMVR